MRHRLVSLCAALMTLMVTATVALAQQNNSLQQEGFTPIDQLPPQEQLPAAPLLIAAYVFVLLVLFVYLFSVARRLSSVKQQIERLEGDLRRNKKA
jgi:CcmD family protein